MNEHRTRVLDLELIPSSSSTAAPSRGDVYPVTAIELISIVGPTGSDRPVRVTFEGPSSMLAGVNRDIANVRFSMQLDSLEDVRRRDAKERIRSSIDRLTRADFGISTDSLETVARILSDARGRNR